MEATFKSRNFKIDAWFVGGNLTSTKTTGLNAEARKYLKTDTSRPPAHLSMMLEDLASLETGLRAFVLAKIGG